MAATPLCIGPYVLGARIGEGGMGQVYAATGPSGEVAIKLLGPAADFDDQARLRFARESRTLAALRHPHIVPLLDTGFDDELGPYLVMPRLRGQNARVRFGGQALGPEAAVLLAIPVAEALAELGARGYVHRDGKPENIVITDDGNVILIDFGLAKAQGGTRYTETGMIAGSAGYSAPEQLEGAAVGPAADVFALGVMLYEWMTGRRPFARARPSEEVNAVLLGRFVPLATVDRRVSKSLAALVDQCLAAQPSARPSAAEVQHGLVQSLQWLGAVEPVELRKRWLTAQEPPVSSAHAAQLLLALAAAAARTESAFVAVGLCDRALAYDGSAPVVAAAQSLLAGLGGAPALVAKETALDSARGGHFTAAVGRRPLASAGSANAAVDTGLAVADTTNREVDMALHATVPARLAGFTGPRASRTAPAPRLADDTLASPAVPTRKLSRRRDVSPRMVAVLLAAFCVVVGGVAVVAWRMGNQTRGSVASAQRGGDGRGGSPIVEMLSEMNNLVRVAKAPEGLALPTVARGTSALLDHAASALRDSPASSQDLATPMPASGSATRDSTAANDVKVLSQLSEGIQQFARLVNESEGAELRAARRALGTLPQLTGPAPTTASGWLAAAETLAPSQAVLAVEQALRLAPGWPDALDKHCIYLLKSRDRDAQTACAKAYALHPDVRWLALRAHGNFVAEKYGAAIADYTAVLAKEQSAEALAMRGLAWRQRGNLKAARSDVTRACQLGSSTACETQKQIASQRAPAPHFVDAAAAAPAPAP